MARLGRSMEQQGRMRMLYAMTSIALAVLLISGVALAILGNSKGWIVAVVAAVTWISLYMTHKYNKRAT